MDSHTPNTVCIPSKSFGRHWEICGFQIANGLGAGNIGDELMARAFWDRIAPGISLDVAVFPEYRFQHEPYPPAHRYIPVNWERPEGPSRDVTIGLLVGDTPVTHRESLEWPLGFLAPRLRALHEAGLPVHAVGVGIDHLESAEARQLFSEHFLPVRSWTVRSPRCREALLALGVAPERIGLGADWAWLYRPQTDRSAWAASFLSGMGLNLDRPLIAVNVRNLVWEDDDSYKRSLADALTELSSRRGLQPFFFCNEFREGDLFDAEAARQVASLMPIPPPIVPNRYYSPDEALAIVGKAQATISFRYHFTVLSVLANSPPVTVVHSQKLSSLTEEFGLPLSCSVKGLRPEQLTKLVTESLERRDQFVSELANIRVVLAQRAGANLAFLPELDSHDAPRDRSTKYESPQLLSKSSDELVRIPEGRKEVLIAHFGGIGDLVLLSNVVAAIKQSRPGWHVTLACRSEVDEIVRLFPVPPDEVFSIAIDPHKWSPLSGQLVDKVRPIIGRLSRRTVDIFISAALQPTWLEGLFASALRPQLFLRCTQSRKESRIPSFLYEQLDLSPQVGIRIGLPRGTHELHRYELLLDAMNVPSASVFPWSKPKRLYPGDYLVCFPCVWAASLVKRWPLEAFAAVLNGLPGERLPIVLLGASADRDALEDLAARIDGGAEISAGHSLSDAAGILAHAKVYLGNDAGPMHLASAYGVPGVAIYGGGHWPSYAPWGRGSIGLVSPLPCFECDWDCAFGRGICVETVPTYEVSKALNDAMQRPHVEAECRHVGGVDPLLDSIIRSTASKYRQLQSDHADRLFDLHETTAAIAERERRIEQLESTAAERLAAMLDRDRVIAQLQSTADERFAAMLDRDRVIAQLQSAADERFAAMLDRDRVIAQLQSTADERFAAMRDRDRVIGQLETTVTERPLAMPDRDRVIEQLQSTAAERLVAMLDRDRVIAQLESTAAERLAAMLDRDRVIAQLESTAAERLAAMLDRDRVIAEHNPELASGSPV